MGALEDDLTQDPPVYERKVHLFHDNSDKTQRNGRPYANTLCRMNSTSPDAVITHDLASVTCKTCRSNTLYGAYQDRKRREEEAAYHKGLTPAAPATEQPKQGRRTRYRLTRWTRKLILQVEDTRFIVDPTDAAEHGQYQLSWRDATLEDLARGVV